MIGKLSMRCLAIKRIYPINVLWMLQQNVNKFCTLAQLRDEWFVTPMILRDVNYFQQSCRNGQNMVTCRSSQSLVHCICFCSICDYWQLKLSMLLAVSTRNRSRGWHGMQDQFNVVLRFSSAACPWRFLQRDNSIHDPGMQKVISCSKLITDAEAKNRGLADGVDACRNLRNYDEMVQMPGQSCRARQTNWPTH